MGLAMTVTRYHYLTDAVGGFCVAVAVVLSVARRCSTERRHGRRDRLDSGRRRGGGTAETHARLVRCNILALRIAARPVTLDGGRVSWVS